MSHCTDFVLQYCQCFLNGALISLLVHLYIPYSGSREAVILLHLAPVTQHPEGAVHCQGARKAVPQHNKLHGAHSAPPPGGLEASLDQAAAAYV